MKRRIGWMVLCMTAAFLFNGCVNRTTYNTNQTLINQRLTTIETNVNQINVELSRKKSGQVSRPAQPAPKSSMAK